MNKQRIPLVLSGACGRMGTTLRNLVAQSDEFTLVAAVERADHPLQGKVLPENLLLQKTLPEGRYVIIDFSLPEATATLLAEACRLRNPLVIGTTGLQEPLKQKIGEISSTIPVLYASNMSFGVNCFFEIVKQAARLLNDYEVEIVETHHHHKKDAPSGTATELARIVCQVRGLKIESCGRYGRSGITGERKPEEIGVHALRLGDVVGEHTVFFGKTGEIIELSHRCYNRTAFAAGALAAARFLWGKPPGLYSMAEVIKEQTGEIR